MKKIAHSLLLAASLLLVFACNLNTGGRASAPRSVEVALSCSAVSDKGLGARSLMDDPGVLSVTVTATDESETTRGGPITLTKGATSWTGSMSITVTGSEKITFEAVGWSGAGGTGNVLYVGYIDENLSVSDTSLSLSLNMYSQLRTWTEQTGAGLDNWVCIAGSSDGTKLAVASYYIWTSSDSGSNWTYRDAVDKRWLTGLASSSDGVKLAAADQGDSVILTSTDSGATWTGHAGITAEGEPAVLNAIASSSDGVNLTATNAGGRIYTSANSGETWTGQEDSGSRNWSSIASSASGVKLAATDMGDELGGYIYTSDNSGEGWTERTGSGRRAWQCIASSGDGTLLAAVVKGGYIYTSTDSGLTWKERTTAGSREWRSIAMTPSGLRLAATTDSGFIYTSYDSGKNWTEQTGAGSRAWQGIVYLEWEGAMIAAVSAGYIYTTTY